MAAVLLLSCFLLAVAGVISVQSATHPVRRDAQQLTGEPLLENRAASSRTGKSDDGLGALLADQAAQLSSLKDKLHALEISQLTAKSELQSTKSDLQSTKSDLQSTKSDLQSTKSELQSTKSDLQSTKSELQSELQSTKSELQSTKSELQSTKSELQSTKSDLQSTKSDLQSELQSTKSELQSTKAELQTSQATIETKMEKLKKGKGSSFVRWGRKTCPNNTTLVYAGVAGGKEHNQKGSGTNTLCLTRTPQFDNTAKPSHYGYLYGAEYQNIPVHHNHDVPCSVCLAPQSTTIMVPATLTCPPGWTPHYTGHLVSQYKTYYATEYVCLDGSPEHDSSGVRNDNGHLFYYVVTVCGSLPCPPFINDKVVTCVVCSK